MPAERDAILAGLEQIRQEIESGPLSVQRGARGHPSEHRGQADRADRRAGPQAAHRALAQRPGRDRSAPLGARCDRCHRQAAARPAGSAARPRRGAQRQRDAGLHPPAGGPAGNLRPSSPGLCRDVRARSRPLRRWPRAPQRMPARRRRAGRHQLSDRPPCDRREPGLRGAGAQLDRCRVGSRLRARVPGRGLDHGDPPVAPGRGAGAVVDAAVRLRAHGRGVLERQLDHAAKAQSRCRRAGARQERPDRRQPERPAADPQGPAARLQQGPAGGQGAAVRRRRQLGPLPRGERRYDRGHGGRPLRAWPPPPRSAIRPRPISPTGWCASSACRSAMRMASRRRRCGGPKRSASISPTCRSRSCRRSSRASRAEAQDVLAVERSIASRNSFGGTAPEQVRAAVTAARERFL